MEDASAAKNLMEILDGLGKSGESESDEETDLVPFLQVHNRYGMAIICMHCLQFTTLSRSKCITLFIGRNFVFVIFAANMWLQAAANMVKQDTRKWDDAYFKGVFMLALKAIADKQAGEPIKARNFDSLMDKWVVSMNVFCMLVEYLVWKLMMNY